MRNQLKVLAVVAALVPGLALAQAIRNTKHDLSSGSTASVKASTVGGTDQICIFCHTPHAAGAQPLIWAHAASTFNPGFPGNVNTVQGTMLPASISAPGTKRCMDCHDASVALGSVTNAGGGVAGTFNVFVGGVASTTSVMPTATRVGANGVLTNNHPVGIPYANQGTYNGVASGTGSADIGVGGYFAGTNSGCINASGLCTTASVNIELVRGTGGSGLTGNGIECVSCHEPHNRYGFSYLLRGATTASAICLGCHNK